MGRNWLVVAGLMLAAPAASAQPARILSIDHYTNVVSIAPANRGQTARLYLRERIKAGTRPDPAKVVLFVHGSGTPAESAFDAPYAGHSWAAYLADAGYDVFLVDLQGYGRSTRPAAMNDLCNLSAAQREQHKARASCEPSHDGDLTDLRSDWNDLTAAITYITGLRGASKVSLIGWSQGGPRAGGWAALHPERVNRMVLLSPDYRRVPAAPARADTAASRAAFNTQTREEFFANWDRQAPCPGQYEPQAAEAIWQDMLASDPVGAAWTPPGRRAPNAASTGWTPQMVRNTHIPTLMLAGATDKQRNPMRVREMYEDIGGDKVYVELACSSHNAMWEKNRQLMFATSREWLDSGTVNGQKNVALTLGE